MLKKGGRAALVVQDSFFKDMRVDLAEMIAEMSCQMNLIRSVRIDFPSRRTMCTVHRHVRKYRHSVSATESVVVLSKH